MFAIVRAGMKDATKRRFLEEPDHILSVHDSDDCLDEYLEEEVSDAPGFYIDGEL